jgi:hypothetical protein
MRDFLFYTAVFAATVAFLYLAPRLVSIAYFRSKAEYERLQRRRPLNGDHNGKE